MTKTLKSAQCATLALMLCSVSVVHASIIELGDLNIIDDAGNASNGLRYLDMTYSDGLSLVDALTNAQATYANARLATASEVDDLFAASVITFVPGFSPSDAFSIGSSAIISLLYDGGSLRNQLGLTSGGGLTSIWTDPDGSGAPTTTRDVIGLSGSEVAMSNILLLPPNDSAGWLIVSETSVPEPTTLVLLGRGLWVWSYAKKMHVT